MVLLQDGLSGLIDNSQKKERGKTMWTNLSRKNFNARLWSRAIPAIMLVAILTIVCSISAPAVAQDLEGEQYSYSQKVISVQSASTDKDSQSHTKNNPFPIPRIELNCEASFAEQKLPRGTHDDLWILGRPADGRPYQVNRQTNGSFGRVDLQRSSGVVRYFVLPSNDTESILLDGILNASNRSVLIDFDDLNSDAPTLYIVVYIFTSDPNAEYSISRSCTEPLSSMSVSPRLIRVGTMVGSSPKPVVFSVRNSGASGSTLSYTVNKSASWISNVTPTSGELAAGATRTHTVNFNTSQLQPGTYTGTINLRAGDGSGEETVTVALLVAPEAYRVVHWSQTARSLTNIELSNERGEPAKICADGSSATLFFVPLVDFEVKPGDYLLTAGNNPSSHGSFRYKGVWARGGERFLAFRYTHPTDIASSGLMREEKVSFRHQNEHLFDIPIEIYRAPVLMTHGLYGISSPFRRMGVTLMMGNDFNPSTPFTRTGRNYPGEVVYSLHTDDGLLNLDMGWYPRSPLITLFDYPNSASFAENASWWRFGIQDALDKAVSAGYSAGRVDIIAHSMGGLLARQEATRNPRTIARILTLNTPHWGSELANYLRDGSIGSQLPLVLLAARWALNANPRVDGAIADLMVGSDAILRLETATQASGQIPMHFIGSREPTSGLPFVLAFRVAAARDGYNWGNIDPNSGIHPATGHERALISAIYGGDPNDHVVNWRSQFAGLTGGSSITVIPDHWHVGIMKKNNVIEKVSSILNLPPNAPEWQATVQPSSDFSYSFTPITSKKDALNTTAEDEPLPIDEIGELIISMIDPTVSPQAGSSVGLTISSPGNLDDVEVLVSIGDDIETFEGGLPFTLEIEIPESHVGPISVIASATSDSNNSMFEFGFKIIDVIPASAPLLLVLSEDSRKLILSGSEGFVRVYAVYPSGDELMISDENGLEVGILDPSITEYSGDGVLSGLAPGTTTATFSYQGLEASIDVTVLPSNAWDTPPPFRGSNEPVDLIYLTRFGDFWISPNEGGGDFSGPFHRGFYGYRHNMNYPNWQWYFRRQFVVGDFNGDGFSDIANITEWSHLWISENNGLGQFLDNRYIKPGLGFNEDRGWKVFVGDFNGDGLDDLLQMTHTDDVWIAFSNGNGFDPIRKMGSPGFKYLPSKGWWIGVADVNGSGRSDLIQVTPYGDVWVSLTEPDGSLGVTSRWADLGLKYHRGIGWGIKLGDFNGNGLADIAQITRDGEILVAVSDGSTFAPLRSWGNPAFYDRTQGSSGKRWSVLVGDVDGDGIDDFICLTPYGDVWVARSNGDSLEDSFRSAWLGFDSAPRGPFKVLVGNFGGPSVSTVDALKASEINVIPDSDGDEPLTEPILETGVEDWLLF